MTIPKHGYASPNQDPFWIVVVMVPSYFGDLKRDPDLEMGVSENWGYLILGSL